MFLGLLSSLVLVVFEIAVRVPGFGVLDGIHVVIEILLVHGVAHTSRLDLLATSSLGGVPILTRWTTTDSCTARQWPRLRSIIILLLLVLIQSCTLEAALDVALRLAVVAADPLVKCNGLLEWHQFREHVLLGRL